MSILLIRSLTYDLAEWHYRRGSINQAEWDLYRFYWRNGAPRFSDLAAEFDIKERTYDA